MLLGRSQIKGTRGEFAALAELESHWGNTSRRKDAGRAYSSSIILRRKRACGRMHTYTGLAAGSLRVITELHGRMDDVTNYRETGNLLLRGSNYLACGRTLESLGALLSGLFASRRRQIAGTFARVTKSFRKLRERVVILLMRREKSEKRRSWLGLWIVFRRRWITHGYVDMHKEFGVLSG